MQKGADQQIWSAPSIYGRFSAATSCRSDATSQSPAATAPLEGEPFFGGGAENGAWYPFGNYGTILCLLYERNKARYDRANDKGMRNSG